MSLQAGEGSPGTLHNDPYEAAKKIRIKIKNAREQLAGGAPQSPSDLMYYCETGISYLGEVSKGLAKLEKAIANRKPIERAQAIHTIKTYSQAADTQISYVKQNLTSPGTPQGIDKVLQEIHVLAQALPTTPEAEGTPADHTLRAMAMILANAGYVKQIPKANQGSSNHV